jgi:HAD superfamily hydrolase (TIGR01490 family)
MTPPDRRRAALFDMDRTLLRVETASLYVRYQRRIGEATFGDTVRVAWWVLLYTFNLIDAPRVATRALSSLAGTWETVLAARCDDWFRSDVERHICDAGRRAVRMHLERGDLVAIATGASPYAARPLARALGIPHVVASTLELRGGKFTGRPEEPLCFGEGKTVRARALLDRHEIELRDATFYSDSITDLPLLEAVGEPVVVNPDPRLARVGKRRGWRIERW